MSIIAPECTHRIYQAMWVEGKDIGSEDVLKEIVLSKNFDWDECMSKMPIAKQELISNTEQAETLGICGVPSLMCNTKIWWGQDRFHDCMQEIFAP